MSGRFETPVCKSQDVSFSRFGTTCPNLAPPVGFSRFFETYWKADHPESTDRTDRQKDQHMENRGLAILLTDHRGRGTERLAIIDLKMGGLDSITGTASYGENRMVSRFWPFAEPKKFKFA
jgi:hypothetical protein